MATQVDTYKLKVTQQGAKETERAMKGLKGSIASITKSMLTMAAAYFGARGLISGMKKVVALSMEQERADKALRAAAGKNFGVLKEQARQFQKLGFAGDEAVQSIQTLLIRLGVDSPREIDKATRATFELATVLKMDVNSASRLVGQAMAGNVQTLARYIPEVRKLTKEQIEQGKAIDLVLEKMGGATLAERDSLIGSIDRLKWALGDLGEIMGDQLSDPLRTAADEARTLAERLGWVASNLGSFQRAMIFTAMADTGIIWDWAFGNEEEYKAGIARLAKLFAFFEAQGGRGGGAGGEGPAGKKAPGGPRVPRGKTKRSDPAENWKIGATASSIKEYLEGQDAASAAEAQAQIDAAALQREVMNRIKAEREKTEIVKEEAQKRAEAEAEFQRQLTVGMTNAYLQAAETSTQAFGQFFTQIVGANSKAANKMAKVMLFMEGSMAVSRGVVALQDALATIVSSQGVSAIQIPPAIALIASGATMMAGSFLSPGRASAGTGGAARFATPGGRGQRGERVLIVNNYSLEPTDPAALGKRIISYEDAARREGSV